MLRWILRGFLHLSLWCLARAHFLPGGLFQLAIPKIFRTPAGWLFNGSARHFVRWNTWVFTNGLNVRVWASPSTVDCMEIGSNWSILVSDSQFKMVILHRAGWGEIVGPVCTTQSEMPTGVSTVALALLSELWAGCFCAGNHQQHRCRWCFYRRQDGRLKALALQELWTTTNQKHFPAWCWQFICKVSYPHVSHGRLCGPSSWLKLHVDHLQHVRVLLAMMGFRLSIFLFVSLIHQTRSRDNSPLHCCFAPTNRPVVLACDQYQDDFIKEVPFAYFGVVPFERRICGSDQPRGYSNSSLGDGSPGGVHIQHHLSSNCVKKKILVLNALDFLVSVLFGVVIW